MTRLLTNNEYAQPVVPVDGDGNIITGAGESAAIGTTIDAAAVTSTVEDTNAKSGISLWKGIKNLLKLINDKLVTGTIIGDVNVRAITTGSNAIGKLAANSGVDIGDVDVTSLPAITGTVTADTELPAAAALADTSSNPTAPFVGAANEGYNGASWDRLRAPNKFVDLATITISTIATVWTPQTGKKFRLMGGSFSVSADCSVLFEDNAGAATVVRTPKLLANMPYAFDLGNGVLSAVANNVLKATASTGTVTIVGHLYGTEE